MGFSNLFCGLCVGVTGSTCAIADAADAQLFVKVFILNMNDQTSKIGLDY